MRAAYIVVLGANVALCASAPAADDGRNRFDFQMITVRGGFVMRHSYLTAADLRDLILEGGMRRNHAVACDRGERYLRRDVRWYAPVVPGKQRCAAVVHVAVCRGKGLDRLAAERARAAFVALEPEAPLPAACGSEGSVEPRTLLQIKLVQAIECETAAIDPDRPMHLWPRTRFAAQTWVDPAFGTDGRYGRDLYFLRIAPESVLGPAAYLAGELAPQFMQTGEVAQQGTNIALIQRIGKNPSGVGYCISLSARQGNLVWRRGIVRGADADAAAPPIKDWPDAEPVLRDAHALAAQFRTSLITTRYSLSQR